MLNPSSNAFIQSTHVKWPLSSLKLRNFSKLALFTRWLSLIGFPILSQSTRNKAQSACALIIEILTKHVLKKTFLPPFIDQIVDDCAGSEIFSLMDGFSGYNQINIIPADQHKTAFICPWGTFAYQKPPFGLKNASTTFQCAMSYAFHDIKNIVHPYLDHLPTHSMHRVDHPIHLQAIFL